MPPQNPASTANVIELDLTTLIAALNAMTQVLGLNGSTIASELNTNLEATNTSLSNLASTLSVGALAAKWIHIAGPGTFEAPGTVSAVLSVNINSAAAGSTVTIYDSTGTVSLPGTLMVASIDLVPIDPMMVPVGPNNRGLKLNNGLVIVTTGTADITVGYV
jgi:hypothetical protein